jgi:hypothetical protein
MKTLSSLVISRGVAGNTHTIQTLSDPSIFGGRSLVGKAVGQVHHQHFESNFVQDIATAPVDNVVVVSLGEDDGTTKPRAEKQWKVCGQWHHFVQDSSEILHNQVGVVPTQIKEVELVIVVVIHWE